MLGGEAADPVPFTRPQLVSEVPAQKPLRCQLKEVLFTQLLTLYTSQVFFSEIVTQQILLFKEEILLKISQLFTQLQQEESRQHQFTAPAQPQLLSLQPQQEP